MGQGGFAAAGKASEPYQRASVAVEAVAVGLLDAALKWEDIGFHWGFYSAFMGVGFPYCRYFLARISGILYYFFVIPRTQIQKTHNPPDSCQSHVIPNISYCMFQCPPQPSSEMVLKSEPFRKSRGWFRFCIHVLSRFAPFGFQQTHPSIQ